jgi:hypothetical protein
LPVINPANPDILASIPTRLRPRSRLKYARGQQGTSHLEIESGRHRPASLIKAAKIAGIEDGRKVSGIVEELLRGWLAGRKTRK